MELEGWTTQFWELALELELGVLLLLWAMKRFAPDTPSPSLSAFSSSGSWRRRRH